MIIFDDSQSKYTFLDLGFSNLLSKFGVDTLTPEFQNVFTGLGPQYISEGVAQFKNVDIGPKNITITPDDDIQEAIDRLEEEGGGILHLTAGTYLPTTSIAIPAGIPLQIIGENAPNTIISWAGGAGGFTLTGTSVYTTGTISISQGSVVLTGSGTVWVSSMEGMQVFLSNRWYVVDTVLSNTSILLETAFADTTLSGSTYRLVNVITDVEFDELTIQSSTSTLISCTDANALFFEDVTLISGNKGITMTNVMSVSSNRVTAAANTLSGIEVTNGSFVNLVGTSTPSNGGSGQVWNNVKTSQITFSASNSNTGDGYNFTDVDNSYFIIEASGNTVQGIELVSGCDNNRIITNANGNTSDGVKITATSDGNVIVTGVITGNTGYGVNIAAASCDNTNIVANNITGNTAGAVNDSGVGTLIRGNLGVDDNSTGSVSEQAIFGDGSDGALSITSGTTTVNLSNAKVVTRNYSSISISSTGKLAFSNPHASGTVVIIKCTGDATLTSTQPSIDVSGLGSTVATNPTHYLDTVSHQGGEAGDGGVILGGTAGAAGSASSAFLDFSVTKNDTFRPFHNFHYFVCGAAGGNSGKGNGSAAQGGADAAGGRGGGVLFMKIKGDINFTGEIHAKGVVGSAGVPGTGTAPGGGGGGSGGMIMITYGSSISIAGTLDVSGGNGGAGGDDPTSGDQGGGGGGGGGGATLDLAGGAGGVGAQSLVADQAAGANGSNGDSNGGVGGAAGATNSGGGAGGGGGGGAGGYYAIIQNKEFY